VAGRASGDGQNNEDGPSDSLAWLLAVALAADSLAPADHTRTLQVDGWERFYLVHVTPKYDHKKPTPVVPIFHGAGTNAQIMVRFCGMSKKSDEAGFLAVYRNGTGTANLFLTWNSGGFQGPNAEKRPNDVTFVSKLLDDLATGVNVDPKRVHATRMPVSGGTHGPAHGHHGRDQPAQELPQRLHRLHLHPRQPGNPDRPIQANVMRLSGLGFVGRGGHGLMESGRHMRNETRLRRSAPGEEW
jgi:hypothetical protein